MAFLTARAAFSRSHPDVFLIRDESGLWRAQGLGEPHELLHVYVSKRRQTVEPDNRTVYHPTIWGELGTLVEVLPEIADFTVVFDGAPAGRLVDFVMGPEPATVERWYHGTSTAAWEAIQREGLRPRVYTREPAGYATLGGPQGDPRYVYLAADAGNDVVFAARNVAAKARQAGRSDAAPIILEIDGGSIKGWLLEPDEDSRAETWRGSLATTGTVRYPAAIPAQAIRVYRVLGEGGWTSPGETVKGPQVTRAPALVLLHVDSLASYAWHVGQKAERLATRMVAAARDHTGLLVVVDQGWGELIAREIVALGETDGERITFDESVDDWEPFLAELIVLLREAGVDTVRLGGVWYDPTGAEGCVTYTGSALLDAGFRVIVDSDLVGCVGD